MDIDPEKYPNIFKLREREQNEQDIPEWAEDSIALGFAERYAKTLRYVHKWGKWFHFNGHHWAEDDTLHVFDRVREVCREIANDQDGRRSSAVASARSVYNVATLAKADRRIAATAAQWDTDPWLLNSATQTIDLRKAMPRATDPDDYITKKAACDCAPLGTPCPLWVSFLQRVTDNDMELRKFLQRYIGYCLTGLTREHAFVFAHGTGGNGKGTFIGTIADIMGDYAAVADTSTFIASRGEHHPTEIAHLVGARLVVAQETQQGRRWNESRIKEMTGGDRMTTRYMRQDWFDFVPTHKLFIAGNHKPTLATVDPAIKRRLLLVPFLVQIPPEERDLELREKLRDEWPAILRWMVQGAIEWQRVGLQPPAIVQDASEAYFADQDTIGQWMSEWLDVTVHTELTPSRDLYASWRSWCDDRGHRPGTQNALTEALQDRGLEYKRTKAARGFYVKLIRA